MTTSPAPATASAAPPRGLLYRLARRVFLLRSRRTQFSKIYASGGFPASPSRSGAGSDLVQTAVIRAALPGLLARLGVASLLDAPCGDFYWMRHVPLPGIRYLGVDIVADLVAENTRRFAAAGRTFMLRDLCRDPLPRVDLILCRDCLVHLKFRAARALVANLKRSGSTWLLTTTYTARTVNGELGPSFWRPLNLRLAPFGFPEPVECLDEQCTEERGARADKALALWRLADLPD